MILKKKAPPIETKSYYGNGFSLYYTNSGIYLFDSNLEKRKLLEIYSEVEPLNSALRTKAKAMKSIHPYLYNEQSDEYTQDNKFISLLKNPTYDSSYCELITEITLHKNLLDNYYIIVKATNEKAEPTELEVARPDRIDVKEYTTDDSPYSYTYKKKNTQIIFNRSGAINPRYFNADKTQELIHWNGINISGIYSYEGNNGIHSAYIQCLKYLKANEYNVGLLKNGARPSGALVLKSKEGCQAELTEEQFDRLKKQMEDNYSGTANAGKPMLLEGGLEFQPMNLTSKDMDFLEGIKFDAKSIVRNVDVPLTLVGLEQTTYNAYPEARISLYEDTAIPEIQEIFNFLFSRIAILRYKNIDRFSLTYNKDTIEPLVNKQREMNIETARLVLASQFPVLTTQEIRELLGFENTEEVSNEDEEEKSQFIRLLKNSGSYSDSEITKLVKNYKSL